MDENGEPVNWQDDPNEPRYCLCNQVSYGEMVGCDNNDVSVIFKATIWAPMGENVSSGFLTKSGSNQPAQLQRLARMYTLCM